MFERFTDPARRVLVLAQEEARNLGHAQIGDELLLFGLAAQPDTGAGQVLAEAGADADRVRELIGSAAGRDRKKHGFGHIPFSAQAKSVLAGAMRESMDLDMREIRTEHLLIALTRIDGAGAELLRRLEVDLDELRNRTVAVARASGETTVEETQATPWSTPRADVETQLAGIESMLQQILARLAAIESRLPEK